MRQSWKFGGAEGIIEPLDPCVCGRAHRLSWPALLRCLEIEHAAD